MVDTQKLPYSLGTRCDDCRNFNEYDLTEDDVVEATKSDDDDEGDESDFIESLNVSVKRDFDDAIILNCDDCSSLTVASDEVAGTFHSFPLTEDEEDSLRQELREKNLPVVNPSNSFSL